MNKKTKWGIIILVGAGIIGGGIYSQLPKKNDELAAADKVMGGNQKKGKQILNVNAKVIKPQLLTTTSVSSYSSANASATFWHPARCSSVIYFSAIDVPPNPLLDKKSKSYLFYFKQ